MVILSLRTLLVLLPLSVAAQETPVANAKKANPNSTQGAGDSQSLATGLIIGVPAVGLVAAAGVIGARKLYHDKRDLAALKQKVLPQKVETEDEVLGEADLDAVEIQDAHPLSELAQTPPNTPATSPEAKAKEFQTMWKHPLQDYIGDRTDDYKTVDSKYLDALTNERRERDSFGKKIPPQIEDHYRNALNIVHHPEVVKENSGLGYADGFGYTLEQTKALKEHLNELSAHPKLYQDVLERLDGKIPEAVLPTQKVPTQQIETIKQKHLARLKFETELGHQLTRQKIATMPPLKKQEVPNHQPSVLKFEGKL
jgi:hypothetical protein